MTFRLTKILLLPLLLFLFSFCSFTKVMTGKVYVIGNEPFVYLAFESEEVTTKTISPRSPVYNELWKHQTKLIKITYETVGGELYIKEFKIKEE